MSAAAEPMAAIRCNVTCVPLQVSAGEKGAARPCAGCEGYQCRQTGERFCCRACQLRAVRKLAEI